MNRKELDEVMDKLSRNGLLIEGQEDLIRKAIVDSQFKKRHIELIMILSMSIATRISLTGDLKIIKNARSIFDD